MIHIKYTITWFRTGYEFPLREDFKTAGQFLRWKREMTEKHGLNFRVLQEWGDISYTLAPVRSTDEKGIGLSNKCEGSTDACILGMDY